MKKYTNTSKLRTMAFSGPITCMNMNPMHDGIFVNIEQGALSCGVKQNPTPRRLRLLLHNRHCLRVCRDDTPIPPSHPLTLSLSPFPITCPNQPTIQFYAQIQLQTRFTPTTPEAKFFTPPSRISSICQLSIRVSRLKIYIFFVPTPRWGIWFPEETNIWYHKKELILLLSFLSTFPGKAKKPTELLRLFVLIYVSLFSVNLIMWGL